MNSWLERLKMWVENDVGKALSIPTIISAGTFLMNLVQSLRDGVLSHDEIQNLIQSSSGIETLILGVAMLIWKKRD